MSTPLFQEALIEAKKLREAASAEAKNAVLEAVSPLIKQMIDREISGVILEEEESAAEQIPMPEDMPPPPPPVPSPDAGATGPIDAAPPTGTEMEKPTMPKITAVAQAAPPINTRELEGEPVSGKFETDPKTGQAKLVLDIDNLFSKVAGEAQVATQAPKPETSAGLPMSPEVVQAPKPEAEAMPASLAEIYRAVNKLLISQKKKTLKENTGVPPAQEQPPIAPVGAQPPVDQMGVTQAVSPEQMMGPAAGQPAPAPVGAQPPAAGQLAPAPVDQMGAQPPAAGQPAPAPVDQMGAQPPAAGQPAPAPVGAQPPAAGQPAPAPAPVDQMGAQPPAAGPVQEYKVFKKKIEQLEEKVNQISTRGSIRASFIKEAHEKEVMSLYANLVNLRNKNAISARIFSHNEERLDLLHENINSIYSYTQNPTIKENSMKSKNSLRDFAHSLFEGAEGFEKKVGHVDPAGNSKGGSAEHAHKVSGNPDHHDAEAEKAEFAANAKEEWPGKPGLLEQLEAEIAEMMRDMHEEDMSEGENESMHMEQDSNPDEAVLEMNDEEVVAEARKARSRLKALREQAEMGEDESEDSLTLTIDLDGVSADEVENVNVSLDGEDIDVDMDSEEDMESEEDSKLMEVRKVVRNAIKSVNENKELRKQLDETQLLTARSLYVNKLFVRDDLSGTQKRKIVEYLDSARTIAEAKEIYNRVVRVLNTAAKTGLMKESAERPTALLNESVEPSFDTARWQVLAGVKKIAK